MPRNVSPFEFEMEERLMNNCFCNLFDNNWLWLIIIAIILISCCCN